MQNETAQEKRPRLAKQRDAPLKFTDSKGRVWHVTERQRTHYDQRSESLLVFESSAIVRCVRTYPADWRELGSDALESLSART